MKIQGELYCGWWVLAISKEGHWSSECHDPEGEVCTDWLLYETAAEAINAAKEFVNLDLARSALSYVLDDWLEEQKISSQEHWKSLMSLYSDTYQTYR